MSASSKQPIAQTVHISNPAIIAQQRMFADHVEVTYMLKNSSYGLWLLTAGSKIRITSMISMALELLAVLLGYKVFRRWLIKTEAEA